MDNDAIAALKAAYEAAAVGKWSYRTASWEVWYDIHDGEGTKLGEAITSADAAFIVAAHTHVPALLAEVERLRQHVSLFTQVVGERELRAVNAAIDVWETSRIKPTDTP